MSRIIVLVGGLGRELQPIDAPFRQPEWSALALIQSPEYVTRVHEAYIEAGADVITTNSYAVVPLPPAQSPVNVTGLLKERREVRRCGMVVQRSVSNDEPGMRQSANRWVRL